MHSTRGWSRCRSTTALHSQRPKPRSPLQSRCLAFSSQPGLPAFNHPRQHPRPTPPTEARSPICSRRASQRVRHRLALPNRHIRDSKASRPSAMEAQTSNEAAPPTNGAAPETSTPTNAPAATQPQAQAQPVPQSAPANATPAKTAQRLPTLTRDRWNHQSVGASANTSIKKVGTGTGGLEARAELRSKL